MLYHQKTSIMQASQQGENMSDKEKIYLIQCLLEDVRGNWAEKVEERIKLAKQLCLEVGGDFCKLANECDDFLSQEDKEEIRGSKIAFIPQSVNFLDPLMKISDQAIGHTESEEEKKSKKIKQREIFEHYNLGPEVDEMYPFQLSGGMARRVLVSTALLSDPELVIADEPTPGLDEKTVKETLNHFRHMKEDNIGVLLITHDIHAALDVSDRIGIFYSGYVIEIAETKDFTGDGENLLHPYTKALYKALPANGFELKKGHQPLHGEIPEGCPYYNRCEMAFDRCEKERPQLISLGNKKVRCFKYEEGA